MKTEAQVVPAKKLQNSTFITNAIKRIFATRRLQVPDEMIPNQTQLKIFDRSRLELIVEQKKLLDIGYGLYMISINYNQYKREHSLEEVKMYFDRFYHQWLIPTLLGNHSYRTPKRHLWPVVTVNTENNTAHRSGKTHNERVRNGRNKPIYHQHAAVAVHPSLIERFDEFVGLNKINRNFDTNIMESIDIRKADEFGILYCLKDYNEEVFTKRYGPLINDLIINDEKSMPRNDQLINFLADTTLKLKDINSNPVETIH